jgi:hypothetical protein
MAPPSMADNPAHRWAMANGIVQADSDDAGLDYYRYFSKARDPALAAGDFLQGPLDQSVGAGGSLLRGLYRKVQRLLQVAVFGSSLERFQWWHRYPRSPRSSKCARTMRLPHVRNGTNEVLRCHFRAECNTRPENSRRDSSRYCAAPLRQAAGGEPVVPAANPFSRGVMILRRWSPTFHQC